MTEEKKFNILVVDDEMDILDMLFEVLSPEGFEVTTANCGVDAIRLAKNKRFDIVLTDIAMPDLSGYEVYHAIKKQTPDLPIVFMTAFGHDPMHTVVQAAKEEGQKIEVILKPFKYERLLSVLRKSIEGRRSVEKN